MDDYGQEKTNVLFILCDDMGAWAMGCAGNKEVITPNLDRLSKTGTRFNNFFCTSPVCSPARASILTGRIPSQHGIHDWIADGSIGPANTLDWISETHATEYLRGMEGYTDVLKAHGWRCGLSGKWHLGDSRKPQKGFDFWYAHQGGSGNYYNAPMIRDGNLVNEPEYITDLITDEGIGYMERMVDSKQPFYLSVHYTAPHLPWSHDNHPEEYLSLYKDCPFESVPFLPPHPWAHRAYNDRDKFNELLMGYYTAITAMDANIGRLIDWLEENGLRQNTLIVFMSDNGHTFGHHGFVGKGNGTFPINMYEESVKVPAIFSQPGRIPQGAVADSLTSAYDFMPTLLDYLGLSCHDCENLPGRSFKNLLLGKEVEKREDIVVYDEYGPVRMVRTDRWKYVHRYPYGPHELYDLLNDPGELENKIEDLGLQHKVYEMRARLDEWFLRFVDKTIDGALEAVKGMGQVNLAGVHRRGVKQYNDKPIKIKI